MAKWKNPTDFPDNELCRWSVVYKGKAVSVYNTSCLSLSGIKEYVLRGGGNLKDHEIKYCCYCGRKIDPVLEEQDSEDYFDFDDYEV